MDKQDARDDAAIAFGGFRLLSNRRQLLEGDTPVRLGSRAFDILLVLLARRGRLVSKEELMRRVWPDTHVVPGNLTVHMAALRRALRDGSEGRQFIVNVPGRGYRFVEPASVSPVNAAGAATGAIDAPRHNLPPRLPSRVDRELLVQHLVQQVRCERLVTLTGPGGIGKSTVALAMGEQLLETFPDGVWWTDLAGCTRAEDVAAALARTLDVEPWSDDRLAEVTALLRSRSVLLIFDNCSHVVEGAHAAAVDLLSAAPGLHILATSREPLRAEGEHVVQVPPLEIPPDARISAEEALRYPAVQLFVQRASAAGGSFRLTDADTPLVVEMCRKLDGIPLAIQLAAGRAGLIGVRAMAEHLCDDAAFIAGPAETNRHRTLFACLDWTYERLTEDEKRTLHRLAGFDRDFTLEEGVAAVADVAEDPAEVSGRIVQLILKSLLLVDMESPAPKLHMMHTTQVYALRKAAAPPVVALRNSGARP